MFDFVLPNGEHMALHIQALLRVFISNKLIICSDDMYRKGRNAKKRFKWTNPGTSLFDDEINESFKYIKDEMVVSVSLNANNDIIINLNNQITIEVMVDTLESEEKYRFFTDDRDYLIFWT